MAPNNIIYILAVYHSAKDLQF
ncbi:hypothetical protein [Ohtaekwangia sp.]